MQTSIDAAIGRKRSWKRLASADDARRQLQALEAISEGIARLEAQLERVASALEKHAHDSTPPF